ncbi:unnamed protein product [Periconia digitata]|uniref:F-box domain-containing protein n=1 Tax=Periconia digitata TaxID=1303443 RepID=A0A9W4U5Q9_9PLEO|nr:unnamed protein product [Periconia digitata]
MPTRSPINSSSINQTAFQTTNMPDHGKNVRAYMAPKKSDPYDMSDLLAALPQLDMVPCPNHEATTPARDIEPARPKPLRGRRPQEPETAAEPTMDEMWNEMFDNLVANNPSPLLRLPPEIRTLIWKFVVGGNVFILRESREECADPRPARQRNIRALSLVNRQVRDETRGIPFACTSYDFTGASVSCIIRFAESLSELGRATITYPKDLSVTVVRDDRMNCEYWGNFRYYYTMKGRTSFTVGELFSMVEEHVRRHTHTTISHLYDPNFHGYLESRWRDS